MNKFLLFSLALLLSACFSEKNIDLATPVTFTRYFSDGYNNEAVAIEETSDQGFIILLNSKIQDTEAEIARDKIVLIKTDQYGNQVWKSYFPDDATDRNKRDSAFWTGHSLTLVENGNILVTGASIRNGKSKVVLLKVDETGKYLTSKVTSNPYSVVGKAATLKTTRFSDNGNYLTLSSSTDPIGKMVVSEIRKNDLSVVWKISWGSEFKRELNNKLFFNLGGDSLIYWGSTVAEKEGDKTDIRLTSTPVNKINATSDILLGNPNFSEVTNDMTLAGTVFCFVGSLDKTGSNADIFFRLGTGNNTTSYRKEFIKGDTTNFTNDKNEKATAVSTTKDGGMILLGDIDTYTGEVTIGRGNLDVILMKVDGFGGYQWSRTYGSLNADNGKSVRQTADRGYIVLGTSTLAGTKTVMLIKTDKNGDVD